MTSSDADLPSYWCPPDEPNDNASQIESGIEQFALVQRALYEMYRNR